MNREAIYTYACFDFEGELAECWLAQFDPKSQPCAGRMERAHLVEKQRLRKEGYAELIPDPRTWRPACRLHHTMLDHFRGLVVPREALPPELETLCERIGLDWYLERKYGEKAVAA